MRSLHLMVGWPHGLPAPRRKKNLSLGDIMPSPQIYILEDRTENINRAVMEKVTQAMVEAVCAPKENVRAWIYDLPKESLGIAGASAKALGLLLAARSP
jgi:4-oxalocrotonate tautomerase